MSKPLPAKEKPLLRGHFHQSAFFFALGACTLLVAKSTTKLAFISSLIYSLGICGMLGISALYHRVYWQPNARKLMRKLDHTFIFVLIAATATPICLLAMTPASGKEFLILIWFAAGIGMSQSLFWSTAPRWLTAFLYIVVGWLAFPYISEFKVSLGWQNLTFLIIGGLCYTLGGMVYAFKFPKLHVKYFGYHELFHVLVIIAAAFHFLVIYSVIK